MFDRFAFQVLPESNRRTWDDLVRDSDQSTIFHQLEWLKIMEKYTNTRLSLLVVTCGGEIFAGIPLFLQKSFSGLVKQILSPPYPTMVYYLGPIFLGYDSWKENIREYRIRCFQKKLDEYLQKTNPHSISIITPPNLLDMRAFLRAGYSATPKYTYIADISDLKLVWRAFKRKLRSSIMKAEKDELEVKAADLKGYNLVVHLLSNRLKEKKQRLDISKEYLLAIYDKFYPKNLRISVCKHEQEEIGGLVSTQHKNKVTIWLCATARSAGASSPTDLLYWETIKWASENGYRYCEILYADSQIEYKSKYNFGLASYFYLRKMRRGYGLLANTYNAIRNRQ